MVASPQPDDVNARISQLERSLASATNKTLYSASISSGGLTVSGGGQIEVQDATGVTEFYVGGAYGNAHSDGTPQEITAIGDENGHWRIALWDPSNPASKTNQQIYMWDAHNNLVFTTDINGGQAVPWYNVPLYPLFTPPQSTTPTNGTVYGYATISTSAAGIAQGQVLWQGRLAYVSHPRITIDGYWGQASGTVVPTYSLKVGGTVVGTWSPTGGTVQAAYGPWDISALLGNVQVDVEVSVTWANTGVFAAGVLGCYLRQT